jgi:hypothetical protein
VLPACPRAGHATRSPSAPRWPPSAASPRARDPPGPGQGTVKRLVWAVVHTTRGALSGRRLGRVTRAGRAGNATRRGTVHNLSAGFPWRNSPADWWRRERRRHAPRITRTAMPLEALLVQLDGLIARAGGDLPRPARCSPRRLGHDKAGRRAAPGGSLPRPPPASSRRGGQAPLVRVSRELGTGGRSNAGGTAGGVCCSSEAKAAEAGRGVVLRLIAPAGRI